MFRRWVLTEGRVNRLAQWVERQAINLAVAGSTPVPTARRENATLTGPREAGQRVIRYRWPATGGNEDSGQSVPWGGPQRNRRLVRNAAAAWQHARGPCSAWIPLPPASGKRQQMPGDSPQGFAQRRRARWKLPCRRRLCACSNDTPPSHV